MSEKHIIYYVLSNGINNGIYKNKDKALEAK